jgi:hypothetical protein
MAYDLNNTMNRKIEKLYQWRDRYSKSEYPYKVVVNLFYELYTIHFMWDEISSIFSKGLFSSPKRYNNFPDAMNHMANIKREIQVREINPKLIGLMESNLPACDQQFEQYKQMIEDAKNGNNDEVEEIEYSYAYITSVIELVIPWAACGLLGMDKHKAFVDVTGGDVGGLSLQSFEEAYKYFNTIVNWQVGDSYKKLPPLW